MGTRARISCINANTIAQRSTVKRVVITSSAVAVYRRSPKPEVWTEADWNDPAVEAVNAGDTSPAIVYPASKTLAEKGLSS